MSDCDLLTNQVQSWWLQMTGQELLQDCLRRLHQSSIDYMLVGSMAGNYWGIPRSTHDIDFVVAYNEKDVEKIVKLFEDDFFIQEISVRSALNPPYQFNALDNQSALKVDFFRLAGDAYELERFKRRRQVTLLKQPAVVAAPEDPRRPLALCGNLTYNIGNCLWTQEL